MPGRSRPGVGAPRRRQSRAANPRSSPQDRGIPKISAAEKLGSVAGRKREPGRMKKLTMLVGRLGFARRQATKGRTVGVGTVQKVGNERQVFIKVVAVSGETFVGKLARCDRDEDMSMLRPGLVVLVAFDPAAREELSLPNDEEAVL